jgi:hypothetical protein
MTLEYDPLKEPLRLLRETSLTAGFDERLAKGLVEAQQQGTAPVIRLRSRKPLLLLIAAIAIPAAAAAASGYYLQKRAAAGVTNDLVKQTQAKPLEPLGRSGFTAIPRVTPPAAPAAAVIEQLPATGSLEPSRPSASPRAVEQPRSKPSEAAKPSPVTVAPAAPRIEALDPFESKSTSSKQSAPIPKAAGVGESLRKATERGTAQTDADRVRGSQRDLRGNEQRGNDAAQQARERVQARERKGQ